jgi:hypothetical protein
MKEPEMREWVVKNAAKVNKYDRLGEFLLQRAASKASAPFVAELVDRFGADVSKRCLTWETTALFMASSAATVSVLLERGADPTVATNWGKTPLMAYACHSSVECAARLLMETDVLMTIKAQDEEYASSTLHWTLSASAQTVSEATRAQFTKLLLLAGADPHLQDKQGRTPLQMFQDRRPNSHLASKHFLQEAMAGDGDRTFLLHKARHLSDATHTVTTTLAKTLAKTAPPTLSSRMSDLSQQMLSHLPRIELAATGQQQQQQEAAEDEEESKKRQAAVLRYVLRLEEGQQGTATARVGGGGGSGGMASEVFYELLKMMGPSYYPVQEGAGSDGKV